MDEVCPAYDPETRMWFTPDGVEASSLRELQAKLGDGTTLLGYVPGGARYDDPVAEPEGELPLTAQPCVSTRLTLPEGMEPRPAPPPRVRKPRKRAPYVYKPAPKVEKRIPWTLEREKQLKELLLAGYSATQVAQMLQGLTRNAVIGKAHRLGLRWGK